MGSVALEGFGSGGASLNFDIKAYETEEQLLAASPKENTVGVVTADTITSWIFSAAEPTAPVEGMVWIQTGTSSTVEFNALKKNNITVYPISAKQYVGGAWVGKTAKTYQGGEWVDWAIWLFRQGDGFKVDIDSFVGAKQTLKTTDTSISVGGKTSEITAGTSGTGVSIQTNTMHDLTNISKVYCRANITAINTGYPGVYSGAMCAFSSIPDNIATTAGSAAKTNFSVKDGIFEMNVSTLRGPHCLAFKGVFAGEIYDWYMS